MTGPTPISAPYRLSFLYTVLGFPHRCRNFCNVETGAGSSGYDLIARSGGINVDIQDAADEFFTVLAPFYNTDWASFDGWLLEVRVGTEFVFVAGDATTLAPTGGGDPTPAVGWCVSGKSGDNKNFPAYIYEGNFRILSKASSYAALNTAEKAVNDYFFRVGGTPSTSQAFNWRMSRGEERAVRWLASVWDSNQKLRRSRRLA